MKQERINRISELTRISRERELNQEEKDEREVLRGEYRAAMRLSLVGHLDNTFYVDERGKQEKLTRKED